MVDRDVRKNERVHPIKGGLVIQCVDKKSDKTWNVSTPNIYI